MFKDNAVRLTNVLILNKTIPEDDFELYAFGFEMMFAIIANIITTVVIGVLFHMPAQSLLFLAAFIPLRSYVGGFHASNHFKCYWLSVVAVIGVLYSSRVLLSIYSVPPVIITGLIASALIFVLVPVQDANRPLEQIEIHVFRRRARVILCVEMAVLVLLTLCGFRTASSVLLCTILLISITACVGAVKNCVRA